MHKSLLAALAALLIAAISSPATLLLTEPFDYTAQTYAPGTWSGSVLSGSGIGWGSNAYFDHSGSAASFVIGGGGPAGTYFESTGQNFFNSYWRNRTTPSPIHGSADGTVTWQSMLLWSDGSNSGGGMKVHNSNGGTDYWIRLGTGSVYELVGGHGSEDQDLSAIAASTSSSSPDLLLFKIENLAGGNDMAVQLWVNPTSPTAAGLPAADLSVTYPSFIGNRNIGGINIAPGAIKIDEIVYTDDYADLGIGSVIPEPSVAGLLVIGGLAFCIRRRRG